MDGVLGRADGFDQRVVGSVSGSMLQPAGGPRSAGSRFRFAERFEAAVGPIGQDVLKSVGLAIAGRWFAARTEQPGFTLFDFDIYAICDEDELRAGGVSRAASIAGSMHLSNLCWIYDRYPITLDAQTAAVIDDEDVAARFQDWGWAVSHVADPADHEAIAHSVSAFKRERERPMVMIVGQPTVMDAVRS